MICTDSAWPVRPAADHLVMRGLRLATGVSGNDLLHTLDVLKHGVDAPEASTGHDGRLRPGLSGCGVDSRRWNR